MILRLGAWVILIRIRPNWHTRLVKVIIYRVGNIQKRGQVIIWITIKIEKIIVISHITQENINKETNKQTKEKKF